MQEGREAKILRTSAEKETIRAPKNKRDQKSLMPSIPPQLPMQQPTSTQQADKATSQHPTQRHTNASVDTILQDIMPRGRGSALRTLRQQRLQLLNAQGGRLKAFSDTATAPHHRHSMLEQEFKRSESWLAHSALDQIIISEPQATPVSARFLPKLVGQGASEIQLYRRVKALEQNLGFRPRVVQDASGIHIKRNNLQIGDRLTRPNFWTTYDGSQFTVSQMFPREEPHHASDVLLADLMRLSAIKQERADGQMGATIWIVPQNIMHTSLSNEPSVKIIDAFMANQGVDTRTPQVIRALRPSEENNPQNPHDALFDALTKTKGTNGRTMVWLTQDLGKINGGRHYEISAIEVIITDRKPPGRLYDLNFVLSEKLAHRSEHEAAFQHRV